ncbi:MAG: N-acyl homoserine lactonase family protein [Christensenellales bacterium]
MKQKSCPAGTIGKWRAKIILCGTHINTKGVLTAGFDQQIYLRLPYLAFLLQDGETNILIDNGMNERFLIDGKAWGGCPANAGSQNLIDSLAREGLAPDDIDLIIYTHLHGDHGGNCNIFPNTKSIVQADEWDNLLNPVFAELLRRDYDFEIIPLLRANHNFFKIDGDLEIMEGIRIIKTPGHTRGSQSVAVNTVNGLRVFVGDQFPIPSNCFPWIEEIRDCDGVAHKITPAPQDWPTMPTALVYDYYTYYRSADKIKAILPAQDPQFIVCGHDPGLLFREI